MTLVTKEIKALTSLRFIAAFLVFLRHEDLTAAGARWFNLGAAGVEFFFLLSGFVLTYTYGERLLSGSVRTGTFLRARLARIWPAHIVAMAIALVQISQRDGTAYWKGPLVRVAIASHVILVQAWSPRPEVHGAPNDVSWSISDEAFFYLLFPLVVAIALRVYLPAVIASAVVLWLSLSAYLAAQHVVVDDWRFYQAPYVRFPDFVVGVALGAVFLRCRMKATKWSTTLEGVVVALSIAAVALSPLAPRSLQLAEWYAPAFALMLYVVAHEQGAISKVLTNRLFVRLGQLSFSFYLVHATVIASLGRLPGSSLLYAAVVHLIAAIALAAILYRYVEVPARRWIVGLPPVFRAHVVQLRG